MQVKFGQTSIEFLFFLSYRISTNSFRGNYSFLELTLCTVTFDHSTYRCRNYSREETVQGQKLFAEIQYLITTVPKLQIREQMSGPEIS